MGVYNIIERAQEWLKEYSEQLDTKMEEITNKKVRLTDLESKLRTLQEGSDLYLERVLEATESKIPLNS